MNATRELKDKKSAVNLMWQTDFTYLTGIDWVWFCIYIIHNDFSQYVISWKLCATIKTTDVTGRLELTLIKPMSNTSHGHYPKMATTISQLIWQNGSKAKRCYMSVERPIIRGCRAR